MPTPLDQPITPTRLRSVTATVPAFQRTLHQTGVDAPDRPLWYIAWIGDLHLHARRSYPELSPVYTDTIDTRTNLALILAEIAALEIPPALILFGGDLADSGCSGEAPADEYETLRELLDQHLPPGIPTLAITGNHDHADRPLSPAWHQAFGAVSPDWPTSPDPEAYYWATTHRGWRLIGLDSRQSQPLSERQRTWLAEQLAADTTTPTLIAVHRPLLCVGNWVDDFRLIDRPTFDLIDRAPNVRLILSGHTHKSAAWDYRGKTHLILPSSAYGIDSRVGWAAIVLDDRDFLQAYEKTLPGLYYECVGDTTHNTRGYFNQLRPAPFVNDPKFNPCLLPREEPS